MRFLAAALLLLISSIASFGQNRPVIIEPPRNAGSYAEAGLANGSIAQGSMFILKGNPFGLCNANPANNVVIAGSFPLNTTMRNVQVRITMTGRPTTRS